MIGPSPAHTIESLIAQRRNGPWARRCYWLPEGWTAPSAHGPLARAALIDLTRPHHRRQERNYAHEEGVRIRAEEKRARRRAARLALRNAAEVRRMQRAARAGRLVVVWDREVAS